MWKPAAVADSILFNKCSNPAPHPGPTYTFGHGIAEGAAAKASAAEDLAASKWWEGSVAPTTNSARNSDVQQFWQQSREKGNAATAIYELTGREVARAVKKAGRGAHVDLKCENSPAITSSLYKDAFCEHHERAARELGLEANPEAYAMYCQAKLDAKANKALGTGSSVNLSLMW